MKPFPFPILLQNGGMRFFQEGDTRTLWIVVVGMGVLLALLVGIGIVRRARGRQLNPAQRRRYARYVFFRMGREIGLQKAHLETLERLVKACKVMQPFLVFSNPGLLDDVLRTGIYAVDRNQELEEEEREAQLAVIFQIKEIIERSARKGVGIRSTTLLRPGQALQLLTADGKRYASQVVSNMKDALAVAAPATPTGQELRWQKGVRLKVAFWREGDSGYLFETRSRGYETLKGASCLLVLHSRTLRHEQRRRHRRRSLERPCFVYPIRILEAGEGRERKPKAVVLNEQRRVCTLLDISSGGCSLATLAPLVAGTLLRIDFEISRGSPITVFGKVRRIRRERRRGGVMHVEFTRVSARHLNRIHSYVYDFARSAAATDTVPPQARMPQARTPRSR